MVTKGFMDCNYWDGVTIYRAIVYLAFQYDLHDVRVRDVDNGRFISVVDKFWSGDCF